MVAALVKVGLAHLATFLGFADSALPGLGRGNHCRVLPLERIEVHYHIRYSKGANFRACNTRVTLFPDQQDISLGTKRLVYLETVYHMRYTLENLLPLDLSPKFLYALANIPLDEKYVHL